MHHKGPPLCHYPKMKSGSNPSIIPSLKEKRGLKSRVTPKWSSPSSPLFKGKSSGMGRRLELGGEGGIFFHTPPKLCLCFP